MSLKLLTLKYEETSDNFKLATKSLAPCFFTCHKYLKDVDLKTFQVHYRNLLQWTGQSEILEDCFSREDHDSNTLLSLLVATATMERALGNLYLIHGEQCPSMLKDLLLTRELETVLEKTVISVLRILIGPPISLNIRNVVWHGFPEPGEIPKRYLSFILMLVPSIGYLLKTKNSHIINHRPHIEFSSSSYFSDFPAPSIELTRKCLNKIAVTTNPFLTPKMSDVIGFAVTLYEKQQYGCCTCLLLPQLEHALRRLFAKVNNCPERILTAESTALYTTFDEMLQCSLPNGQMNNLIGELTEPKIDLLFDLLVHPEGPRIRDRLSHGEASIKDFPEKLASAVIGLFTSLILMFLESQVTDEQQSEELVLVKFYKQYESRFHPMALVKLKLKNLSKLTDKMYPMLNVNQQLEIVNMTEEEWLSSSENLAAFCEKVSPIIDGVKILWNGCKFEKRQLDCYKRPFSDSFHIIEDIVTKRITTSFRGHAVFNREGSSLSSSGGNSREAEIVTLLLKVELETEITLKQTIDALLVRQQQLLNRELRSRQRENMKKLIGSLPFLNVTVHLVLFLISWLLYSLEEFVSKDDSQQLIKFLKTILQCTENMRTFSSKEKNKWMELQELCIKCVEKIQLFVHNKS